MILILASALYLMPIAMPAAWSNVAAPPPNEGWILLQDSVEEEYRFAYQDYWQFVDNHGHWADLLKHFEKKNGKEKATATFFQFYLGREDLAIQQEWQHTVMGWDGHKPLQIRVSNWASTNPDEKPPPPPPRKMAFASYYLTVAGRATRITPRGKGANDQRLAKVIAIAQEAFFALPADAPGEIKVEVSLDTETAETHSRVVSYSTNTNHRKNPSPSRITQRLNK